MEMGTLHRRCGTALYQSISSHKHVGVKTQSMVMYADLQSPKMGAQSPDYVPYMCPAWHVTVASCPQTVFFQFYMIDAILSARIFA